MLADGDVYAWDEDGEPAQVSARTLVERVDLLGVATIVARHWPAAGQRQDCSLAVAGALARAGKPWTPDRVARFIHLVAQAAGAEEPDKRASAAHFTAQRLDAGRTATGLHALRRYLPSEVVDRVQEWLHLARDGETARGPAPAPTLYTARELLALDLPPIRWLVPGILAEGALLLFVGRAKIGKSWAALQLALAVASGGRALGQLPAEQGDVLYLGLEDGPRRLRDRLRQLLGDEPPPEGLTFVTEWPRVDQGGLEQLDAWLEQHPACKAVMIDTLKRIRARTNGNRQLYDLDYEALEPLQRLAARYGVALVAVHHANKRVTDDVLDSVTGSTGLEASADAIAVLRRERGQPDASLFVTGRDYEQDQDLALRWDGIIGGWAVLGGAAEHRLSAERRQVLALLRAHGPLQPSQAAGLLDKTVNALKLVMWKMAEAGQLVAVGGRYAIAPQEGCESECERKPWTSR